MGKMEGGRIKDTKIQRNSGAEKITINFSKYLTFCFVLDAFFCLIFSINYNFNLCHSVHFQSVDSMERFVYF